MSNKRIVSFEVFEVPSPSPETKYEMSFKTADEWFYTYTALSEGEPFTFEHKRRPDMGISEDDVTPQSIKKFIDDHPSLELIDSKVIYTGDYPN